MKKARYARRPLTLPATGWAPPSPRWGEGFFCAAYSAPITRSAGNISRFTLRNSYSGITIGKTTTFSGPRSAAVRPRHEGMHVANTISISALILAALALILWIFSVWIPWLNGPPHYFPRRPEQQKAPTDHNQGEADHGDSKGKQCASEKQEWGPDENHHRRHERFYWRFSLVFAGIATFAAIGAAFAATRAFIAAQGQLEEMQADQRPWISAKAELDGDLVCLPLEHLPHSKSSLKIRAIDPPSV